MIVYICTMVLTFFTVLLVYRDGKLDWKLVRASAGLALIWPVTLVCAIIDSEKVDR